MTDPLTDPGRRHWLRVGAGVAALSALPGAFAADTLPLSLIHI